MGRVSGPFSAASHTTAVLFVGGGSGWEVCCLAILFIGLDPDSARM